MLTTNFSPWPLFTEEEAEAVKRVVLSNQVNYWTGIECREFEKEFARFSGSEYAIALANGTVALDLALKVLGIGPGDEVIVTPRTFIASISCVVNAGATPVFADVDRDYGNITVDTISTVLTDRTKAIICVHLAGWPCDMDPIMELAERRGLFVIEDCAQAHGARYKGRSVGSIGHVGAWSFCQDKIMTTGGEGGMVTTNDEILWQDMWAYKDHGKSYKAVYERDHPPGFRWLHESFGTNWRMTEMQAAIGRIQLRRMNEWSARRQENANRLREALTPFTGRGGAIRLPAFGCTGECENAGGKLSYTSQCMHANYKFYAYVQAENIKAGWTRDHIIDAINADGIPCYQGSCSEVYLEKAFDNTGFRPAERLPLAKELGDTSLMFLVHPTLTEDEITKTAEVIHQVMSLASK
ncbi:MAG: DegT/DnrJ/EryC1/StrS aminotransferase family protein [Sedimenticola sp.]|nr:DegT/DnrJ/EryC1/StrS aminotransferase family protein [Sedimenticola sp.]